MKWIAHRGNVNGPSPDENKPSHINAALAHGYDVEIDVWLMPDGLYLGHNSPDYKTNRYFLQNQRLWIHCKNIEAYNELSKFSNINCFFQDEEIMVMTSQGYYWAHSKCNIFDHRTVITKIDARNWYPDDIVHAVCSDYVSDRLPHHKLPFDLLIIDIDGILTDGTKIYDRDGKVFGKTYCDLDFTAMKRFQAAGIKICFLSGDTTVNKPMAETRKIPFYYNPPGSDKVDMLSGIKQDFDAKCIAYVGDDYYDIAIMDAVDLAFCPINSPKAVKKTATVLDTRSGEGVIANLYDLFDKQIPYAFPVDSANVNPI